MCIYILSDAADADPKDEGLGSSAQERRISSDLAAHSMHRIKRGGIHSMYMYDRIRDLYPQAPHHIYPAPWRISAVGPGLGVCDDFALTVRGLGFIELFPPPPPLLSSFS